MYKRTNQFCREMHLKSKSRVRLSRYLQPRAATATSDIRAYVRSDAQTFTTRLAAA